MDNSIAVIGSGSWGIALAWRLWKNGSDVTLWARSRESAERLRTYREDKDKLPGVILDGSIKITDNLEGALKNKDMVVITVPSVAVREVCKKMKPYLMPEEEGHQIIVNCAKGIEAESLMLMSDVILDELPGRDVAVLSGPSHAEEVGKDLPTTIVVSAFSKDTAKEVQNTFMADTFRVYTSPDMLGIEIGGALKNVIALAAGVNDGLGYGDNAKAALITRGIAEMSRLGVAMGGDFETFSGLSGIGDLVVTCASMHSRNRRAGILIGQGKTADEATKEVKMVVEGINSASAALALSKKYDVEMPIVEQVNEVLFNNKPAIEAVTDLMNREGKDENDLQGW
ncbi:MULTISPECIES: NAD(P)H-dependent glycerol-3-phosphate dehydrogenase [unclassified Butyrivibrio]|uniref:NAD(P)H-dependent glycerol-3-phosphate dehydrogenase n=1 Tax=unclassified Butyrivibrio TaxID=2639466 RepID=UPI0003B344A0|nr:MULTISPECIES: NAD(P)H-dependent glycerol-3-phosphate dehydrogenase [unclassified Butyrivibrio]SDB48671.1 glycerol-3-phosphate dehydrogenase (NAD(P)+) [Butyrivibrio sp. INlla16]SEK46388.1 glycerol-3-phosphate dehydrogenase (NAD(P)+) [Butyrivibrio sp. ob235]